MDIDATEGSPQTRSCVVHKVVRGILKVTGILLLATSFVVMFLGWLGVSPDGSKVSLGMLCSYVLFNEMRALLWGYVR
mgnify:CR=1 FL=1